MNNELTNPVPNQLTPSSNKTTKTTSSKKMLYVLSMIILLAASGSLGYYAMQQHNTLKRRTQQSNSQISDLNTKVSTAEKQLSDLKDATGENNIDKSAFQSVFLKSGQVYFGKITKITEAQITLTNIYYLQVSNKSNPNPENITQDTKLVKLGNELHGPQDTMYIERKEVDFWENLKNDGQVAKAIVEYEKANPIKQ